MKKLRLCLLALLMLSLLCACGSTSYDSAANEGYAAGSAYNDYSAYDADWYDEVTYAEEESYWEEPTEYAVGSTVTAGTEAESALDASADFDGDKIIYTGYATVETKDFDQCTADVQQMISRVGGFLESSSIYGADYYGDGHRSADYTIRIPRGQFDAVTQNLSNLGNVSYISVDAENVGAEYHDTESHLAVYRTEEERLLELLEAAETVEDMLNIEDRLADVRYNIEALTTRLSSWDSLISYSTLHLSIEEVVEYTAEPELGYWARIGQGFVDTLEGTGEFFANLLAWLIVSLPVLAILAAVAFGIVKLIKAIKKRRGSKRKKAVSPAQNAPADYQTFEKADESQNK